LLKESLVSSDSIEIRKSQNIEMKKKSFMMNRLNWITYLKILYDQLEKTK
jgi:hypothetical protein